MSLVSNTGPLIALAKVDQLCLLKELFGEVLIAPAVYREILAKVGPEAQRLDEAMREFIHITEPALISTNVEQITANLGVGEQQAIALAYKQATLLLIDDRSGRTTARHLGVKVTGTVGVLI